MNNDLISRSALKKAIKSYADDQYAENEYLGECAIMAIIDNAPAVEVTKIQSYILGFSDGLKAQTYEKPPMFEKPQGEWIIVKDEKYGDNVKCPFCSKELAGTDLNFCCKCGAKLVGSEKMNDSKEK